MELTPGPGSHRIRGAGPPSPPCAKHTFLFVNESTATAGKKVGRRRDIKSHVRNHIVQREKRDRKKEGTTNGESDKSKAQPPQIVINFDDKNGSLGWNAFRTPLNPGVESDWNTPQEDFGSDTVEDARRLPIQKPVEPKQVYPEHGVFPRDVFIESTITKTKDYHAIQEEHEAHCVACGAVERAKSGTKAPNSNEGKFSMVAKEAVRWQNFRAKPLTVLGSGRKDPFSCYPTLVDDPNGTMHELMDHSISYLLPGLLADGSRNKTSSVSKAWMAGGLKSPLLFHALVFAGSIHLDFLRSNEIHPNAPVALSHKLAVIQQLNNVLSDPIERIRDEIILAILILSSHEVMDLSGPKSNPFNSPLKSMQWLNVYGNIRNVHEHLKAVMDLVTLRGGVESLELYGLAEILIGGDVVAATTTLSKPAFLPLKRSNEWVAEVIHWAKSPPRLPYISLGRGFQNYRQNGITSKMIDLFEAISAVTIGIDHYLQGEPMGLSLTIIARTRTACQQRLLALPPVTEISELPLGKPYVYEAVRMTALIHGVAVLLPIPRSYSVLQQIIQRQLTAIQESEIEFYGEPFSDLLLWMLMLGGIASLDKRERDWYEERLVGFVQKWDVRDFKDVERIMGRFLWLDSACRAGGRQLWHGVMERSSMLEMGTWVDLSP